MAAPVIQFKRGLLVNLPGLRAGEPGFTTDTHDLYVGLTSEVSTNKFFGSHRYWRKEDGTTSLRLALVDKDGINNIQLKSPNTLSGITTYTLPETINSGYFLRTNSLGILEWSNQFPSIGVTAITAGIATFTDTTDNTLGDPNTGAVQIDGGLGVNKNVTIGQDLYVQGQSTFVGVVTFQGGTINLGDSTGDNINVGGEFVSGLYPDTTATYDLGDGARQWRHGNFSGIVTASTGAVIDNIRIGISGSSEIDTSSGDLTIDSATGKTIIDDNLSVTGFVTVTNYVAANNFISTTTSLQAPTIGNYSGERLRLFDFNDTGKTNYAIGVEGSNVWFGVDDNIDGVGFKWYGNTTQVMRLGGTGNLTIANDLTVGGNDIKASDGTTALTLSASSGNVKTGGDLIAGSGYLAASDGTRALYMYGTSGDVSFQGKAIVNSIRSATDSNNAISLAGRDVTLENNATIVGVATVGVALSVPTIRTATLQHQNGTQAATIDSSGNITASQNLTVSGNLYVNGSTTQVNTDTLNVEDRTIELGRIQAGQPLSTTWDLAVLFNYGDGAAKKAGVVWEASGATKRFQFTTDVNTGVDGGPSDTTAPAFTVANFAPIEVAELWVNNSCTGGAQQVIGCVNSELNLQNITVDAGTF